MRFVSKWIFVPVLLVLIAGGLQATTVLRMDLEALTQEADMILVGTCANGISKWVDRQLITEVEVSVEQSLKGKPGEMVRVALPGGVDTQGKVPIAMIYPGAPVLTPGERVLLFLDAEGDLNTIVGFAQGCMAISTDSRGVEVVSSSPFEGTVLDAQGNPVAAASYNESLESLLNKIRALLQ